MQRITLIIPGLLPPPAAVTGDILPACPALRWILGRADDQSCSSDYYRLLFERFELTPPVDSDWPVAALGYLAETGDDPGYCLRADPVHLSPGREGVVLLNDAMLHLGAEEAQSLAADVQTLFSEFGATLVIGRPAHWYLHGSQAARVHTVPLHAVAGRDVSTSLPTGPEQTRWRQLFNEIQMLLHESGVNRDRSRKGQLPVNSLWFWGAGSLPAKGKCSFDICFSDDPCVRGLGRLHGATAGMLPEYFGQLMEQAGDARDILVVNNRGWHYSCYQDAAGWLDFLERLERDWMVPLKASVNSGVLKQLHLIVPGREFILKRSHRWYFWRRPKAVTNVSSK